MGQILFGDRGLSWRCIGLFLYQISFVFIKSNSLKGRLALRFHFGPMATIRYGFIRVTKRSPEYWIGTSQILKVLLVLDGHECWIVHVSDCIKPVHSFRGLSMLYREIKIPLK